MFKSKRSNVSIFNPRYAAKFTEGEALLHIYNNQNEFMLVLEGTVDSIGHYINIPATHNSIHSDAYKTSTILHGQIDIQNTGKKMTLVKTITIAAQDQQPLEDALENLQSDVNPSRQHYLQQLLDSSSYYYASIAEELIQENTSVSLCTIL